MSRSRKWSLRKHARELRKHFPTDKPVRIRYVPKASLDKCHAWCWDGGKYYYIQINKALSLSDKKDCLWHEWAHLVAGWSEKHHHTNAWGVTYSKIYKHMHDDI